MTPLVSVIIVYYRAKKELLDCLISLHALKTNVSFEIIVVDNDDDEEISKASGITYIKSPGNIGFGAGNNLGAKKSSGEFLFFLNSDTLVFPQTLERLVAFIKKDKNIGIVAPLLLGKNNIPLRLQGLGKFTVLEAIFAHSFFNRYFPQNSISRRHFLTGWDKRKALEVDIMPGAAFMIRRDLFERAGRFDEHLFLYFEEADLARRVQKLGFRIWMVPQAKVVHLGQRSTQSGNRKVFIESRFYYFKKHFGLPAAVFGHIIANIRNPFRKT